MKSKILLWSFILLFFSPHFVAVADEADGAVETTAQVIEQNYHLTLEEWKNQGIDSTEPFFQAINPSSFIMEDRQQLVESSDSEGYGDRVFYWHNQESVVVEVEVEEEGLYELSFDYYPLGDLIVPIEGAIEVNGEYPFFESRRIVFPVNWQNESNDFDIDRFGNEIIPKQVPQEEWHHIKALDSSHMQSRPLKFHLEAGSNEIQLENLRGELLLGDVFVTSVTDTPTYEQYLQDGKGLAFEGDYLTFEAEYPFYKNSSYVRPTSVQDPSVVPYESDRQLLNTFGGDSWMKPGQKATWEVEVPEAGYYQLTLKVKQNIGTSAISYRTLSINGDIPFLEVEQYPFSNRSEWYNETFSHENGEPFYFFFEEGKNEITLEADATPNARVLRTIDEVMAGIEELSLDIRKLTGNQQDRSRDWVISDYIPGIDVRLTEWAKMLEVEVSYLEEMNDGNETTSITSMRMAIDKLLTLAKEPDRIPSQMSQLSEGSNSSAQLLGNIIQTLQAQPLTIDRFYLHTSDDLPKAEAGWWTKSKESVVRFINSFRQDNLAMGNVSDQTVEIWVNRPRQYVELLQNMADQNFTPETGIEVKFSLMPDEGKLILASAADTQPDLAIGISNWLPYELAIRGAAVDLRQFEEFKELGQEFSPGAFLPYIVEDGLYALPETQDFNVQFYRRDIMEALDIPIPDTWDDVTSILPELQRYGFNYYTPIAGAVAFKPFQTTAPFIYQHGGDLYESDGIGTTIDSEESLQGIQFMSELNTLYSTPLQVPNFYNHFRYSTLPIGIANFETYVQLTAAAPEISGWWELSPHPGVEQEDGNVARWAMGSGQSAMIFEGSDLQDEAWQVLKWWMSSEVQTEFATSLQTLYGPEYMWNTANIVSFGQLPLPQEHKDVVLEQWEYLKEVPKTPYAYMVEREISNVWNTIVFDGETTRSAVDDAVVNIDREMRRKLEEFGYIENGRVVKPYPIPTIELVEGWLEIDEDN
ncbi:extracellular solute-binding protein [Alkalihalobacillus pseudalcaliphilus]|uniref:extracellular solute-binding protein n=1 Tax=Alkalihalobacillus pseudalcaliphilus TaxID=79884 RepID=UPI00064D736B|nr:extracellular solute-binding protein [Alkalihalobacillus pseudalcaliphilus]KMK74696.1 ABC transporter substrate-binding protein [Alkalihalobacillus pseudalcaliphilus]